MARICIGIGTSHTPQVSTTSEWWTDHAERDRRNPQLLGRDGRMHTFDELATAGGTAVDPGRLTVEVWDRLHARSQQAIGRLKTALAEAAPDVVVVIGDDQEEMFLDDGMPAFAVYYGDTVFDMPPDEEKRGELPDGLRAALWAIHNDSNEPYKVPATLGRHIIEQLIIDEFDVTALRRQPEGRTLGHAFTFVRRRLMGDAMVPLLPVALNAYTPPNTPTPRRCYSFGRALRRAIESFPEDIRVAVVASGGLSHFVIDEELDRRVIDGLTNRDVESLTTIPTRYMRSGTSEILNWIAVGGAVEHLSMELLDYVPGYRSTVGTGVGMAFAVWH